jgi:hypothetical protein
MRAVIALSTAFLLIFQSLFGCCQMSIADVTTSSVVAQEPCSDCCRHHDDDDCNDESPASPKKSSPVCRNLCFYLPVQDLAFELADAPAILELPHDFDVGSAPAPFASAVDLLATDFGPPLRRHFLLQIILI